MPPRDDSRPDRRLRLLPHRILPQVPTHQVRISVDLPFGLPFSRFPPCSMLLTWIQVRGETRGREKSRGLAVPEVQGGLQMQCVHVG